MQKPIGTKDIFAESIDIYNKIVDTARDVSQLYNFRELQTPMFELESLFERNLGDDSDVVSKEIDGCPALRQV